MPKQAKNQSNSGAGSVKKRVREQRNFQVFLKPDEWQRFLEIYERAKRKFDSLDTDMDFTRAQVVRRLVGLDKPNRFVTQQDIDYFLYNKPIENEIVPELPGASPDFSEIDTESGQSSKKKAVNGD